MIEMAINIQRAAKVETSPSKEVQTDPVRCKAELHVVTAIEICGRLFFDQNVDPRRFAFNLH